MSRRVHIIIAFVVAVAATGIGWSQTLIYMITPVVPLALWFPLIVLTGAHDVQAVALSLVQFPLFATAFALGIRRWPVVSVLGGLVLLYGLLAGSAYIILEHR